MYLTKKAWKAKCTWFVVRYNHRISFCPDTLRILYRFISTSVYIIYGPNIPVVRLLLTYSTSLISILRKSKLTLRKPSTRFAVVKKGLSESALASYTLCGSQNRFFKLLKASYTPCGSQNVLFKILQDTKTLWVVNTDLANFYKHHTRFAVDKTGSSSPLQALRLSKRTL